MENTTNNHATPATIGDVIDGTKERFLEIAPTDMKYNAERGFAVQLLNNNAYLLQVAKEAQHSLQEAIINVAAIGLSLNPAEKLAYLIPRNVKAGDNTWKSKIFLEPSYMGMIRLATNTGTIKWVQAAAVYANDSFVDNGAGEKPTHNYNAFDPINDRGEFVGVYCVAKTNEGDFLTTIMPAADVYDIRGRSESYKKYQSGVWKTDFIEMAKKTAVRRAFKTWPRTDNARMLQLAEAVEISNKNEGFEPILTEPYLRQVTAGQKGYFDELIETSNALGMFIFMQSLDVQASTNLYHSFPKGQKGKYQKIADTLVNKGRGMIDQYRELFIEATQANDETEIERLVNELSGDELECVFLEVPADVKALASGYQ
ncbi:MAG: hypothetical protein DRQ39_05320 [Gammaproteobacteria bacterium]|nr:MAG: hypothetical protein DRQ39_05320 [Gammaproteobacteria bacterium]